MRGNLSWDLFPAGRVSSHQPNSCVQRVSVFTPYVLFNFFSGYHLLPLLWMFARMRMRMWMVVCSCAPCMLVMVWHGRAAVLVCQFSFSPNHGMPHDLPPPAPHIIICPNLPPSLYLSHARVRVSQWWFLTWFFTGNGCIFLFLFLFFHSFSRFIYSSETHCSFESLLSCQMHDKQHHQNCKPSELPIHAWQATPHATNTSTFQVIYYYFICFLVFFSSFYVFVVFVCSVF
jgi:hypothetical protein